MQIEIRDANLLDFDGDGILVPSNSEGRMVEGISKAVKELVGQPTEDEVVSHAPIAVGACLVTETDAKLPAKYLVHAPMTESPGMRVPIESIRRATRASLIAATKYEMQSIGVPGVNYPDAGYTYEEAARAIIDEINGCKKAFPQKVVLLDTDPEMLEAFDVMISGGR